MRDMRNSPFFLRLEPILYSDIGRLFSSAKALTCYTDYSSNNVSMNLMENLTLDLKVTYLSNFNLGAIR